MQRLEEQFKERQYLSSDDVSRLAILLNLSETRVSRSAACVSLSMIALRF